jgi:hypothetical protein
MKIWFVANADVSLQYTKFICKTHNMVLLASCAHLSWTADVPVTDACHHYCLRWCDVTVSGSIMRTGNRIKMSLHAFGRHILLFFLREIARWHRVSCEITLKTYSTADTCVSCLLLLEHHHRSRRHSVWKGLLDRKVDCLHLVQPVAEHSLTA